MAIFVYLRARVQNAQSARDLSRPPRRGAFSANSLSRIRCSAFFGTLSVGSTTLRDHASTLPGSIVLQGPLVETLCTEHPGRGALPYPVSDGIYISGPARHSNWLLRNLLIVTCVPQAGSCSCFIYHMVCTMQCDPGDPANYSCPGAAAACRLHARVGDRFCCCRGPLLSG